MTANLTEPRRVASSGLTFAGKTATRLNIAQIGFIGNDFLRDKAFRA
jgi:hypothetical protein